MNRKAYFQTFFIPELRAILGNYWLIAGLILIVTLSLWSIGFSNGSARVLSERMNSPFVRFLSVTIPGNKISGSGDFQERLNKFLSDDSHRKKYHYKDHYFVPIGYVDFQGVLEKSHKAKIRYIEPQSSLYKFIVNPGQGLLLSDAYVNLKKNPWSVIVTDDYLKRLGYNTANAPPFLPFVYKSGENPVTVSIPIANVVDQLPNRFDIFMPPTAFYAVRNLYQNDPLNPESPVYRASSRFFIWTKAGTEEADVLSALSNAGLPKASEISPSQDNYRSGFYMKFNAGNANLKNQLGEKFGEDSVFVANDYARSGRGTLLENLRNDFLVIEFNDLQEVSDFTQELFEQFGLRADMGAVESMKNFSIFNIISKVLSLVLTTFAIIILIYSVSRSVLEHIERNAESLGTLKAFGLSNNAITLTYGGIALLYILLIFIGSFAIASAVGQAVVHSVLGQRILTYIGNSDVYVLALNLEILLYFLIIPIVIVLVLIFRKLSSKSPGDLIYNR